MPDSLISAIGLRTLWSRMQEVLPQYDPWLPLLVFLGASFLMIWRLGVLERKGLEGTVLGTVVMPYATGFSNLMFAFILGRSGANGTLVLENCLVNNATNLTLLLGLPALFWTLSVFPEKAKTGQGRGTFRAHRLNQLSLLLSLVAALFFTGALWALARDGELDFGDGLVLVGLFVFWQVYHIFDVLKQNVYRGRALQWSMAIDAILVIIGGIAVFQSIDRLVAWMPKAGSGFFVFENLGWLSGILMVLPNALPAIYYAWHQRADIVYSSQVGDGHICIPMCIGLFALFGKIQVPGYFNLGVCIIIAASLTHFIFLLIWGRLPRIVGLILSAAYAYFLYKGIIN